MLRKTDHVEIMKVKTSIALDQALLDTVNKLSRRYRNRSALVEAALQAYVARIIRHEQDAKDLEIINRHAAELNQEALDVLDYQVKL